MNKTFLLFIFLGLFTLGLTTRTGSPCQVTEDCPDLHECEEDEGYVGTVCVHKPLFPITAREVIGSLIIIFLNSLLTAGGVGAAAAYVPYIMVLFNFTLSQSVAIGYCTVFGGGVGNLINIIMLKSPKTKRFLTNYNINMIVLPALMIGIMIGMILQRSFPPIVTNLILMLVLIYSFTKNFMKLKLNLKKERQEKESAAKAKAADEVHKKAVMQTEEKALNTEEAQAAQTPEQELSSEGDVEEEEEEKKEKAKVEPNPEKANNDSSVITGVAVSNSTPGINIVVAKNSSELTLVGQPVLKDPKEEKRKLLEQQEQKFPFHKVRELLVNIVIIIIVGLIRGTKKFDPVVGVDWTCGWDFGWFAVAIILFGLSLARNIHLVLKWQKEKEEVGYEFLPEEPHLDQKKITRLLIVSTVAGIIGAIVALGGSMIVGPTLLDLKMPPAFSAATTSVFMIFSMFNTMFQTILNKKIAAQELAWFLPLSLVFSYTSSKVVNWYVKKTGKQSTIIMLILAVTTLGFGCLIYVLISGLITDFKNETTFTGVC